jgi:hypothetical protein
LPKHKQGLILYNITNGITALKKHVYIDHCMIAKIFEVSYNLLKFELNEKENLQRKDLM